MFLCLDVVIITNVTHRLIHNWFLYASKYLDSPKNFTINMHYLNHVPKALRLFGPTRIISARPIERTIGKLKTDIKSKRSPAENSYSSVLKYFGNSYEKIQKDNEYFKKTISVEYKSSNFQDVENGGLQNLIGNQSVRVIRSYSPTKSGQTLRFSRSRSITSIVFSTDLTTDDHQNECIRGCTLKKYGLLKLMYDTGADERGIIEVLSPIEVNNYGVHYYNPGNCIRRWETIDLKDIILYGIEIQSIDDRCPERVNLLWKE